MKVLPFADVITKVAPSPQLIKDPECWSGRESNPDLPHKRPALNQLSQPGGGNPSYGFESYLSIYKRIKRPDQKSIIIMIITY